MRICQLAFLLLEGEDKEGRYNGAYKQRFNPNIGLVGNYWEAPDAWQPTDMLPKIGYDRVMDKINT